MARGKASRTGRTTPTEHFAKMIRSTMEEPAWRALSSTAQALYPWLKLEWSGAAENNNGQIRLSVRQAAERMGVGADTASYAFHDLQAKGFVVVTEAASLGVTGQAKSPAFELTEIAMPFSDERGGRKLYRQWSEGSDFPVQKAAAHNPRGRFRAPETLLENPNATVRKTQTSPIGKD